jgi:acetyl esterase/lipase
MKTIIRKFTQLFAFVLLTPIILSAGEPEKFIYKTVDDTELELYVFRPQKQDAPSPAIVWYYGSGLRKKDPGQFFEHGKILSKMGMVSVHTNIRGWVDKRTDEDVPRCIEDAKSAFRWVRAHANELNLDPERIAVGGGSSGGFLATSIATLPGFDATTDDTGIPLKPSLQILFNPGVGGSSADDKSRSPIQNVTKGIAPAVIFHGTADTGVPLSLMYDYQRAMDKVGSDCTIMAYKDQTHGFFNYRDGSNPYYYKTVGDMILFLENQGYLTKN